MNRLAMTGLIADPWGVPRSRSCKVPSATAAERPATASRTARSSGSHGQRRLDRFDDQVPRNAVEELPDVQIDYPVAPPAASPACRHRVQLRLAVPVPVGVRVEQRVHHGLQPGRSHGLRDSAATVGTPRTRVPPPAASVSLLPSPGAGSTSPTTSGSRSCRGCPSGRPRTPRWTARPPRVRPCSLSP